MLRQVADGVRVSTSEWVATNTVVVEGPSGVLLIDPGVLEREITDLASALDGRPVVAGFTTHPHWDHLLWHASLGAPPRWATARSAATAHARLADGVDRARFGIPDEVSLDLLGAIVGLPDDATQIPWDGPAVRILEHRAHAPGHAALLVGQVLVAGDLLSDVLVPMLDVRGAEDPIGDHLAALELLDGIAGVAVVVPGHGSVGGAGAVRDRVALDRAYLAALRDGREPDDPRITSPADGWEWVRGVHEGQVAALAARG